MRHARKPACSSAGVPKPGVATSNGVGMITRWGRKEFMGSMGSQRGHGVGGVAEEW